MAGKYGKVGSGWMAAVRDRQFIGDLSLDFRSGPACVVDLERMGVGDYELYGSEHFEGWERDIGLRIERGDILVIHTGYHRFYPENLTDRSAVDETCYFIRRPGPTREFARVGAAARRSLAGLCGGAVRTARAAWS